MLPEFKKLYEGKSKGLPFFFYALYPIELKFFPKGAKYRFLRPPPSRGILLRVQHFYTKIL